MQDFKETFKLPRPQFARIAGLWFGAATFCVATFAAAAPPNIVVFLADDAGAGDYGFAGNRAAETPRIDSLAAAGVSLDRFFVCAVCSPTRAEFLTGRHHPRSGVRGVSTGRERMDLGESTLAESLKRAGYATGAFGKWHNGSQWPYHPRARGFDEYFGHTSGHWGEYFDPPLEDEGRMVRAQGYIVDVCTDRALAFIERNKDRPFFCYVPFTTPHSPWAAPEQDWRRFKNRPVAQQATNTEAEKVDETRCALAMLANQDHNVGRVLDKLAELDLSENTIVVYFSDNGPNSHRWTGGLKGVKGSVDEGGVRSVCLLRWPARLPAGMRVSRIAAAIDLLPTLLALAGVERGSGKPLDGRDLSGLLVNAEAPWPDRRIFSVWAGRTSVRTERFRLDNDGALFDMLADPGQTKPVNDQHPGVAAELAEAIDAWKRDVFAVDATSAGRGTGRSSVDPRPIPVGYREFPTTMLPARDGEPVGNVRRSSSAPNCSYFVDWTSTDDRMAWLIDVHTAGDYEVAIDYTCPEADAGSLVELQFQDARLRGRVQPAWDPPLYTNQDTLPRPHGESQMKPFKSLALGKLRLDAGQGPLVLRAVEIPGKSVMDVRRVTLTLLP